MRSFDIFILHLTVFFSVYSQHVLPLCFKERMIEINWKRAAKELRP